MTDSLSVSVGQHSDKGRKAENQDFYGVMIPREPLLGSKGVVAAIADGVSSSDAGKQASEACVSGFLSDYLSTPDSWSVKTSAQKVLNALNSWLYSQAGLTEGTAKTMVTTLSALIIKSTTAHIFHVGDSRIYRLQNSKLECVTHDHRVWLSSGKNYLNRAMGIDVHLDIDYRTFTVEAGDTFVFTTDGVHDYLSDKTIGEIIVSDSTDLDSTSKAIVEAAFDNGALDNITCQILRIDSLPSLMTDDVYKELTRLPFPPFLSEGQILDGYKILNEIHASKRTQVYKGVNLKDNTVVAIKTPSVNFEDDPAYIESFIREEWIGKRIKNKHVVKIIEQTQKRQCLYYLTEYVNGQTLRQWMLAHPQPDIKEVQEIVKQIASGLRAFHRLEMLHQDLKPENIMLDALGCVKIIDFGSTKIAGIAEITTPLERINLLGTKNYTAPEYLIGQAGTNRSDIFSLGIITYEILTGKLPYGNDLDKITSATAKFKLKYRPSYHYNPMIPIWIDKTIEKAVSANPQMRYELLSEFVQDLSKPNSKFLKERSVPLIEQNPLAFWRALALLLALINIFLLCLVFLK